MTAEISSPIVKPFSSAVYELMLRQPGTSYAVAEGWSIGWSGNGWQVFYHAIDAFYRLSVAKKYDVHPVRVWSSFQRAWVWLAELTADDIYTLTVASVSGDVNAVSSQPIVLLCQECEEPLSGPDDGVNLCAACGASMPFGRHE